MNTAKTSAQFKDGVWSDTTCVICLEDVHPDRLIKLSGCSHGVCNDDFNTLVHFNDLKCPECRKPFDVPPNEKLRRTLRGHSSWVTAVAIQGDTIVSGSVDMTVKVWDLATGELRKTLRGHSSTVTAVAIQGDTIVSGSYDKTMNVWDLTTGELKETIEGHSSAVYSVAIQGDTIVSGSDDKTVKVWNLERVAVRRRRSQTADSNSRRQRARLSALVTAKTSTESTQNDILIARLIDRLNAGEVIPDKDLEGINLAADHKGEWISKIIVASAGKPGQGVLTRIDPNIFNSVILEFTFGLFPAKGKFDFNKAVTSLMGLLSTDLDPELKEELLRIYLGFWLYHGTEAKYRSTLWSDLQYKLSVMDFNKEIDLSDSMLWDATEQQWELFKRYNTLPFYVPRLPYKYVAAFAPLPIIKLVIETKEDKFNHYTLLLNNYTQAKNVYKEGGPGVQPKGSIVDFVNATSGLVQWDVDELKEKGWDVLHTIFNDLKNKDALNPATLKWLSETPFVKNAKTLRSMARPVATPLTKITTTFLVAITPGILEKYQGPMKKPYEELMLKTQKETRDQIVGVVLGLHGAYPSFAIPKIVMNSLPWERVWIGVDDKREHGKMAASVEAYIRKVVESADKVKAERLSSKRGREYDNNNKVGGEKGGKKVRLTAEVMPEDKVIAKLKQVFALEVVSTEAESPNAEHQRIEAMKEKLTDLESEPVIAIRILQNWVLEAEKYKSEEQKKRIATVIRDLQAETSLSDRFQDSLARFANENNLT